MSLRFVEGPGHELPGSSDPTKISTVFADDSTCLSCATLNCARLTPSASPTKLKYKDRLLRNGGSGLGVSLRYI